jgi:hypothetical protein
MRIPNDRQVANGFTTVICVSTPLLFGQFRVFNVFTRINGFRYFVTVLSFFFDLVCLRTDERAYLV